MTPEQLAWVQCTEIGCTAGLAVDIRHVRNFEDRWHCPEHESEVPC